MIRLFLLLVLWLSFTGETRGQQFLTADEAVERALSLSGRAAAAQQRVAKQQALLPAAVNLPAPELTIVQEGRTLSSDGIAQSFAFPTVYVKQYQVQKQETVVAERERQQTVQEIAYEIRVLYLNLQYAESLQAQRYQIDSLYAAIAQAAARQFDAGQINFLQKSAALMHSQEAHAHYLQSVRSCASLNRQLQLRTGHATPIRPSRLEPSASVHMESDSMGLLRNPRVLLLEEQVLLEQQQGRLARHRTLPNLRFEYIPGMRGEAGDPPRLNMGLSLPLWQWQYRSKIKAASAALEVAESERRGYQQELTVQLTAARQALQANREAMVNLRASAHTTLQMIGAATRMLEAGELDYVNFLRSISDAYRMRERYLQVVKDYNQAMLDYHFIIGEI